MLHLNETPDLDQGSLRITFFYMSKTTQTCKTVIEKKSFESDISN